MTLKEQIVDFLGANSNGRYTNQELAKALGRPEPSVRRVTSALVNDILIADAGVTLWGAHRFTAFTS